MQYKEGIKAWLNNRKISNEILEKFAIKYDDKITIPITDENGIFIYNKYRRNPLLPETGPKYWYDKGCKAFLFGAQFIKDEKLIVITEGELDALVLWSQNIPAISSTGGAMTFNKEWTELLKDKQVLICLDNDKAGCSGAMKILTMIPSAKIILLPEIAGVKDITDYYSIGKDLRDLIQSAKHYISYEDVIKDRNTRRGEMRSTLFHETWIEWWENEQVRSETIKKPREAKKYDDEVARAKAVKIKDIIKVKNNKAFCLWHSEGKIPNLHVYDDNHSYCFSCGKRADVIDIVMELQKVDFKTAIEYLNNL